MRMSRVLAEKILQERDNPMTVWDAWRVQTRLCSETRKMLHSPTVAFEGALE